MEQVGGLRAVLDRPTLSPAEDFTVEVLDASSSWAVVGYVSVLDEQDVDGWRAAWALYAAWGGQEPHARVWDGHLAVRRIGLSGPLRYRLPIEVAPGEYRLRDPQTTWSTTVRIT